MIATVENRYAIIITFAQILVMTNEQIEKFLVQDKVAENVVSINFKTRNSIRGIFINAADFHELKSKNFWRIVREANIDNWKKTKDLDLARIFNGTEITKLSLV
jgi:hypothetical protein